MGLELSFLKRVHRSADSRSANGRISLDLQMSPQECRIFQDRLQAVFEGREVIFRFDAVEGEFWTLYFKLREGESRALCAHPDSEHWVATIALDLETQKKLHEKLSSNIPFLLSELTRLTAPSNLDLSVSFTDLPT